MFDITNIEIQTGSREVNYRPYFNVVRLPDEHQALVLLSTPGYNESDIMLRVTHYENKTVLQVTSNAKISKTVASSKVFEKFTEEVAKSIENGIIGASGKSSIDTKIVINHDDHKTKIDFVVDYSNGMVIIKLIETVIEENDHSEELSFVGDRYRSAEEANKASKRYKNLCKSIDSFFGSEDFWLKEPTYPEYRWYCKSPI